MDLLWYAQENEVSVDETALAMDMSPDQVRNAFDDFTRKRRTTHYLRAAPLDMVPLGDPVPEAD
jgi:NAD+ synthase